MKHQERIAMRAAACIRETLVERRAKRLKPALPETAWEECEWLARHIEKADAHGWYLASQRMRERLARAATTYRVRVERFERECEMDRHQETVPAQRQLFLDLIALEPNPAASTSETTHPRSCQAPCAPQR